MIFFVDEDASLLGGVTAELRLRGRAVESLHDARTAFQRLWNARASDVELAVIDVMLDPGELPYGSLVAGLSLLRDLSDQNPAVFPRRAVLLTAGIGETLRDAQQCAAELHVKLWHKYAFTPFELADQIELAIQTAAANA
ncbi:MAG: hypothetical protein WBC33_04960 [Conexibacter sp.]